MIKLTDPYTGKAEFVKASDVRHIQYAEADVIDEIPRTGLAQFFFGSKSVPAIRTGSSVELTGGTETFVSETPEEVALLVESCGK